MSSFDPTESMRMKASLYPEVDEGTACTQSSFKANKKGFLYCGEQGGRYKAMFKLSASRDEALALSAERPKDFQVGNTGWVTARFSAEEPMPSELWAKWLDESYALCFVKKSKKKATNT